MATTTTYDHAAAAEATGGFGDLSYSQANGSAFGSDEESSTSSGTSGGTSSYAATDYTSYLNDLYAAQTESELAALTSAYETSLASLQADVEAIPETYYDAKNTIAGQSAIESANFAEQANAQGVNSGASSQAALTTSAVNQSNYASLDEAEADALAENALAQSTLTSEYESAIAQATASGNASLAQALYNEYVRLDEANYSSYVLDYNASQDALAQENYLNEFNYGASQDALAQENYLNQLASSQTSEDKSYAYSIATTMLAQGTMPDSATLTAAGISTVDAQAIVDASEATQATSYSSSSENYDYVAETLEEMKASGYSATDIIVALESIKNSGDITQEEYNSLYSYWGSQ